MHRPAQRALLTDRTVNSPYSTLNKFDNRQHLFHSDSSDDTQQFYLRSIIVGPDSRFRSTSSSCRSLTQAKMRTLQAQSLTSTPKHNLSVASQRSVLRRKQLKTFEQQEKKRRRRKPGTVALKQIKYYQSTTEFLIPLLPFSRLVREIADLLSVDGTRYKFGAAAMQALQCAAEAWVTGLFEDTNKAAIHAKRITNRPEDMRFVRVIRAGVNVDERI